MIKYSVFKEDKIKKVYEREFASVVAKHASSVKMTRVEENEIIINYYNKDDLLIASQEIDSFMLDNCNGCNIIAEKMIQVTDDWYPNYPNNKIRVKVFTNDYYDHVRICAWGLDDFGVERDFKPYCEESREKAMELFNTIPNKGVDKQWFYDHGFETI